MSCEALKPPQRFYYLYLARNRVITCLIKISKFAVVRNGGARRGGERSRNAVRRDPRARARARIPYFSWDAKMLIFHFAKATHSGDTAGESSLTPAGIDKVNRNSNEIYNFFVSIPVKARLWLGEKNPGGGVKNTISHSSAKLKITFPSKYRRVGRARAGKSKAGF